MKQFLLKLFYFLLPFVVLAYPVDYGISYFLSQSNQTTGEFEVMNDIYSSKASCDVAIYGSSRAWVQIDTKIISDSLNLRAYNFGIDGHNFWLQYLRHLELLKNNNKPTNIILSLDVFTLHKRPNLYQPEQFLPYMLWNKNIIKYTSSYIGYNFVDYYIPCVRYFGKRESLGKSIKMALKITSFKKLRYNGFLGIDSEWNSDLENAKSKKKGYEIALDKKTSNLFENFIKNCKKSNINLIFVYTPEYIEGQKFVKNRSQIISMYTKFSKQYHIPFYDYSNDSISFQKKYFYNSLHLNKRGAELFTKKFIDTLKSTNSIKKLKE